MSIYCCMNSANKSPLSLRSTSSNCHVLFGYLIVLCTYHLTIAQQARDAVAVTSTRCRGCHEHGTPWLSWARDAVAVTSTRCRGCHEHKMPWLSWARDAVAVMSTRCLGCHEHGTPWLSWARDAVAVMSTGCRGCHEHGTPWLSWARDAVAVMSTGCLGCHEHGTPWLSWARDAMAVMSTGRRGCHEQTSDQCTTNHVDVNWTVTVTMIIRFRLTSELNVNNTACSCARERSYMRTTVADGHKFSAVRCLRRKLLDQS